MRILIVEDDKKIASFVVNGFKQNGFAVDHARDGEEAVALLRTTPYDAAVLDIMLPKMDGLAVLQEIRRAGIKTPVIILSAKASVDDRVRGLQAGGGVSERSAYPAQTRKSRSFVRHLGAHGFSSLTPPPFRRTHCWLARNEPTY